MQVNKIQNIANFVNLRRLNLFNNCISTIQGLESCRLLEELNLEKNKISVI
jgi:Leucine-rich repeat (LRR) protein